MFIIVLTPTEYGKSTINEKMVVTNLKKYDNYQLVTFKVNEKNFIYYDYSFYYHIGYVYKINGRIEKIENVKIFNGFNAKNYYLGLQIYGYLHIDKYEQIGYNYLYLPKNILFNYIDKLDDDLKAYSTLLYFDYSINEDSFTSLKTYDLIYLISITAISIHFVINGFKKFLFHLNVKPQKQEIYVLILYFIISSLIGVSILIFRLIINQLIKIICNYYYINLSQLSKNHLSFYIMLIIKPTLIYSSSLIIYFLIVNSIILFKPILNKQNMFMKNIFISMIIQFILILFIGKVNIFSIFFSFGLIYVSIFLFVVISLSLILPFIWPFIYLIISKVQEFLLSLNKEFIPIVYLGKYSDIIIFLIIVLVCLVIYYKSIIKKVIGITLILLFMLMPVLKLNIVSNPKLYILDVGQGDSAVILDSNCVIVVDAYQNVVSFLKNHAVNKIDYLIISHTDNDHFMEFNSLINTFKVRNVLLSKYDKLSNYNNNYIYPDVGDNYSCGNFNINILGPLKNYKNKNDNSLVAKVSYYNYHMLFLGDISKEVETDLLNFHHNKLASNYLKIAHHGSNTSSDKAFINAVNPSWASISTKENNRYGFPHREVLEVIADLNVCLYRTDEMGSILFDLKRKRIKTYV